MRKLKSIIDATKAPFAGSWGRTKFFVLSIIMMFLYASQSFSQSQDGGEPGAFLKNGFSVRASAMGHSFVSIADDASAIFYNPGGLINITGTQAVGMYSKLFNDVDGVNYGAFGIAHNFDFGIIGIGAVYLNVTDIPYVEDETGPTGLTFSNSQTAVYLSYTKLFLDNLNIGGNLKFINHSMDAYSGTGFGLDLGLYSTVNENLTVGLMFQDMIGAVVKLNKREDKFNTKTKFGFVYKPIKGLKLAPEVVFESNKDEIFSFGAEYAVFNDIVFLRSGFSTLYNSFSAGVGLKYMNAGIDYSFNTHKYLGNINKFGFNVSF